ncbi:hypothetical protein CONCODRAFT_170603 [Conidiobolus coronatus NRRL 28638]|uniref:Uncharacterized protein n=1 Tax=Conidiobolus coronatus (strain ATCC 28846 / CBS 209.66 / NRRL 28638) TaxID=796925 RepID=A0A137P6G7_CONC2|nr:hypothetical protein CONCODRAFT_170603 [Conidiobolus coronatus NRRL 28638]|eukprot:KXN70598.1 hypothetical protein CONCODRAFT_170603 [Conidiobolus coronatus NRRL 28638]
MLQELLANCLSSLFNLLLILAGILSYILYGIDPVANRSNVYLGAILIIVAFLNALVEFVQLQKSASVLESFLKLIPQQTRVVREGTILQIPAQELVVGDVAFIRMGDKVPADLLIFHCTDMKVDNSSLTGESEPQERLTQNDKRSPLEAVNMVFNGTLTVSGEGYGIVVRTGDNTVLGQIAGMTAGEKKNPSPLSVEIDNFVKFIATLAFATAIIFFILSIIVYKNISTTLNFSIGVFMAWVPEGLPATVTMLLTLAAKRMATQNVLVKDLQGVETLGAITLLATDKTGTLTRNQMTVTKVWSNLKLTGALRSGSVEEHNITTIATSGMEDICFNCALNSKAKFDRTDIPVERRQIIGDATESGLTRFAATHLKNFDAMAERYPKLFEIPFNSDNKWAMSINNVEHETGDLITYFKGAPERILKICSYILLDGKQTPLTEEHKAQFMSTYEHMAGLGHRVLAFAQLKLNREEYPIDYEFSKKSQNYPNKDLCFVGLVSLEDPPKHGVREAIGRCRTAGIRVMMVTGDHPLTAEAIGRKINLMLGDTKKMVAERTKRPVESILEEEYNSIVIHGDQISSLTDTDWDNIFNKEEIIFARTSPKNKLEIVKRAQSIGHIVGVTGDGVNDSPALKKADLGIAMNESGSDVSKEAAAMVLLDDNFASTIKGIEEGRLIFSNLKKSIQYTLSHSMPEVIPQLLYILVPFPLPLSAILILVIDLGFELFAALSYAWDKPETATGLMKMKPRKPVTPASIERLRRIKSRELPPKIDVETGETIPPTRFERYRHTWSRMVTWTYWKEKWEPNESEVMVDLDLLSYSFLEMGMIEALICHIAFFWVLQSHGISLADAVWMQRNSMNPEMAFFTRNAATFINSSGLVITVEDQLEALAQAQSMYYLSVMICQGFNVFACKAKLKYPFGKHMWTNWRNFFGIFAGFVLGFLIVYIPAFNVAFESSYKLNPKFWVIPIIGGCIMLLYATLRVWFTRRRFKTKWNPDIPGLQMYPTPSSKYNIN